MSREKMLENVKLLGERACCYAGNPWPDRTCDCKYGIESDTSPHERAYCGEQTGCPELRDVFCVLKGMTDEEFDAIQARIDEQMLVAWREYQAAHPEVGGGA